MTILAAAPRLLNPTLLDGNAAAAPPPPAPRVGSCLAGGVTSSWGARGVLRPADTVYVTCDRPHRAEVVRVLDPPPDDPAAGTVFEQCAQAADVPAYLGGDDWQPALQMRLTASGPDARQVAAGQYWAACVLVDDVGPALSVPLAGAAAAHTVPPEVGVCFDGSGDDLAFRGTSPCALPHGGELFGRRSVDGTTDRTALTASCRSLVEADTRRPAVTVDPDLLVEVVLAADGSAGSAADPVAGERAGAGARTARCVVRAVDGRQLTGSLRLLGDAPLPWSR